ncbi:uncharacterized protein K02A2.6-like [Anoplophora glabripennis]|uniref:uncharacterized protein K02A2.6-like n=1 Tax=Anoplophora glabripennis TaxID=217634 RepID=UPI0008736A01|nr:uncharacterized protein K02A2.6-like [Anoplophora glabripennis]
MCGYKKRRSMSAQAPLKPRPPSRPWQTVSVDVMGPYRKTRKGNRFLIVLMDVCSKWVEAIPIPLVRPRIMIDFLKQIFQRWGYPETFISDNGPTFRSHQFICFLQQQHIAHYLTPIYHPRSNPVERRNQELNKLMRVHSRQRGRGEDRWDENIDQALFTLRNRQNQATWMSPSVVLLGAPLTEPGEWNHPEVRRAIQNASRNRDERLQRVKRRQIVFNRNLFPDRRPPKIVLNVDDRVLARNPPGMKTPLGPPWIGPYRVLRVCGLNVYEIDWNDVPVLVHIDDLRPWEDREQWQEPGPDPMHLPPE